MDILESLSNQTADKFGEIRIRSLGAPPDPHWLKQLDPNDCDVIEQVRRGNRQEALFLCKGNYLLVKYAPFGLPDDTGKQYGYTAQQINSSLLDVRQSSRKLKIYLLIIILLMLVTTLGLANLNRKANEQSLRELQENIISKLQESMTHKANEQSLRELQGRIEHISKLQEEHKTCIEQLVSQRDGEVGWPFFVEPFSRPWTWFWTDDFDFQIKKLPKPIRHKAPPKGPH